MDSSPIFLICKAVVAFALSVMAFSRALKLNKRTAAPLVWWGYWLFGASSFGLTFAGLSVNYIPIMPRFLTHALVVGFMISVLLILLAERKIWSTSGGAPNHLLKWEEQHPQKERRAGKDRRGEHANRRHSGTAISPAP